MPAEILTPRHDLRQLLAGLADAPAVPITGIADDSRRLEPGNVFIACAGATTHGLQHAEAAIAAGVAAIVWDASTGDEALAVGEVPFVAVQNLAANLGDIANRWYDWPSRALNVIGVTGTNGKTTVAFLAAQCLQLLGRRCGYIGTLGSGLDELTDLGMTTPPCLELHRLLAGFRDAGATDVTLEVSSHALDQDRVSGVRFGTTAFTNLSRDHIDYHGDMQSYGESKARLFTDFESGHRVVSLDSEFGRELAARCGSDAVVVSSEGERADDRHPYITSRSVVANAGGSRVAVDSSWGHGDVDIPLHGDFNVSNALEVLALLLCSGIEFADACAAIEQVKAPPGRMQLVEGSSAASVPGVFVDYSHTPAALEAALRALRPHTHGRLWCVFGCGGDRDRGKRPMMGEVASRLADCAIVTSDNPRSESPAAIIAEVLDGMDDAAIAIENRAAAIAYAVAEACPEDTVLIAGKGHEEYQLIGGQRLDFSDYQTAAANIAIRLKNGVGR